MGQVIVAVLTDTRCSSPMVCSMQPGAPRPVFNAGTTTASIPHSCVYPAQKNMYTWYVLCPLTWKGIHHETVKKSRWVLFRAVILSHKICTYHSPVNFHVIHNFSSSRKTKKKHTEYKSYFKARISITYKVFIWRTINKNIIQPGRTPAVHLPQAPSPNIHFIHHGPKRSDSVDLSQCSHFHERVHVHTDTYTHTVFVGHSPHVVSSVQYNWARGKEPKLNL